MTPSEAHRFLTNLRQMAGQRSISFYDKTFPKQAAFINDSSKFTAGFCTRRSGKSYGAGLKLFSGAYHADSVSCLYVALTRDSAKKIMFRDVLGHINKQYGLGAKPNLTDLTYTLPNNSTIYLLGMDASEEEAEKALGQKFKVVVVDEAGSFRRDLRKIIYGVLSPACADLNGSISLIGTPTSLTKGFFYDVVWAKTEPGWSIHQWSAFDNPYMARQWAFEIDELKKSNPHVVETTWFRQMYMGEYVVDSSKLVYKFNKERNIAESLPEDLTYVLGVDLGFEDPSAFSVVGFSKFDSTLYIVETYKRAHMIISDVAERISYYQKKYQPYKTVIDGAAKQSVEELKRRFNLPLQAADKAGKAEFIEIMNSELIQGRIKSLPTNDTLLTEWSALIWDERSDKREELSSCDNHLADATLYAWRYAYQYLSREKPKPLTEQEKLNLWVDKEADLVMQRSNPKYLEGEW